MRLARTRSESANSVSPAFIPPSRTYESRQLRALLYRHRTGKHTLPTPRSPLSDECLESPCPLTRPAAQQLAKPPPPMVRTAPGRLAIGHGDKNRVIVRRFRKNIPAPAARIPKTSQLLRFRSSGIGSFIRRQASPVDFATAHRRARWSAPLVVTAITAARTLNNMSRGSNTRLGNSA